VTLFSNRVERPSGARATWVRCRCRLAGI